MILVIAAFVSMIDRSVMPPLVPVIADDLGSPIDGIGLSLTVYAASYAALQLGWATLAARFGRVRILVASTAIGSTIVGQGLDSAVFMTVAFAGIIPLEGLVAAVLTQWLVKTAYEALATPLTYAVVGFLKRRDGVDADDSETRFNPLSLAE